MLREGQFHREACWRAFPARRGSGSVHAQVDHFGSWSHGCRPSTASVNAAGRSTWQWSVCGAASIRFRGGASQLGHRCPAPANAFSCRTDTDSGSRGQAAIPLDAHDICGQ